MSRRLGPDAPLPSSGEHPATDLRLVPAAIALWVGMLAGLTLSPWPIGVTCGLALAATVGAVGRAPAGTRRLVLASMACLIVAILIGAARAHPVHDGPVSDLAAQGAYVTVEGEITTEPQERDRPQRPYVVGRLRIDVVEGRGETHHTNVSAVLVADPGWRGLLPGQRIRADGRLSPTDGGDVAAVFSTSTPPDVLTGPSVMSRATEPLRDGLRAAARTVGDDSAGLVPALIIGDESLIPEHLKRDMTDSGLAHLTAVSGMNVTIVLVVVLGVARWAGLRGYLLPVVGAVAIAGFVALARPEPSVVRAAVMGVIAITGSTMTGRRRGLPTLAAAVVVLLLIDPWLARSVGFALSVLATAGILIFAPVWQRELWWLPSPIAVAVTVPLAAQAACLPILVTISGQASVVSVPANILAAPAIVPVTILGAAVALVAPVASPVAGFLAWCANWPAGWIAGVAAWCADLPGAVLLWPVGVVGTVASVAVAAVVLVATRSVLRRPQMTVGLATLLVVASVVPMPSPGWPPRGWVVVACDVGQGDALALRVDDRAAVVVDAGPNADAVDGCLDDLGIDQVPVLILTHFDADHVLGVPGVLDGRRVGLALLSPVREPAANAEDVTRWLDDAGVAYQVAMAGMRQRVGVSLEYEVVWPRRLTSSGSASNNASVVLKADVSGVSMLLTGDVEPEAQVAIAGATPSMGVDVLKVPHHGSPNQNLEFLTSTGARLALVSVGENDYGHPAPDVLESLRRTGIAVARTDVSGDVAVVRLANGELATAHR